MIPSTNSHLNNQISALVGDKITQWMDKERKHAYIKSIRDGRKNISFSKTKWPKIAPYSSDLHIDKVSLFLISLVSSTGYYIPKIQEYWQHNSYSSSNNLQSIPGFQIRLNPEDIKNQLNQVGAVFFSLPEPTASLFKKIYPKKSINSYKNHHPVVASRILNNILISGLEGVSFTIKIKKGTFINNAKEAKNLALLLKNICYRLEINTSFTLHDANQPLGQAVGNSLELREVLELLKGKGPLDILKLTIELGADMLLLSKMFSSRIEAKEILKKKIIEGNALKKFKEIIEAQKGNPKIIDDYSLLPKAKENLKIFS